MKVSLKLDHTDEELHELLKDIYGGEVDDHNLPEDLYHNIADYLKKGLYEGFGGNLKAFQGNDLELLQELRENIYIFSAAKTYQQVRDMTDALLDHEDKLRSFGDFKNIAGQIFEQYNVNWLSAEYDTAIASGQAGVRWNRIESEKEVLPNLRLSVVEDENTSDICEPLDGITLPVEDPFWNEYYPPNHFRCRTTVEQLEADAALSSKDQVGEAVEHADEHMNDAFKMNVGKDKVVFSEEHPYFDVPPKDMEFAENNFGLPMPPTDEPAIVTTSIADAEKAMEDFEPIPDEETAVKDYTGSWAYGKIQGYLRNGVEDEYIDHVKDLIGRIDSYLEKAPKFEGTSYRGLQFNKSDKGYKKLLKAIKGKGEITDEGFMSTSADEQITSYFMDNPSKESMFFEIEGKSGVSISHLARDPGEKEVMFPRGTKFKVVSYEEKDFGGGAKHINVKLKEL